MKKTKNKWLIGFDESRLVMELELAGNPIAHQRPRFVRTGHCYTPKTSREYRKSLSNAMRKLVIEPATDKDLRYGVQVYFYRSNGQRIDIDNLLKSVLDSGNDAKVWKDDSQVIEIAGRLYTKQEKPRIEIVIYYLDKNLDGIKGVYKSNKYCEYCGNEITSPSYPSSQRRFCSYECSCKSKRITLNCRLCGKEFEIPRSLLDKNTKYGKGRNERQFCSRKCSLAHLAKSKKKNGSDKWRCHTCGGRVSRKEYTRCKACFIKSREEIKSNYWGVRRVVNEA